MARGRRREEWEHTATLMAWFAAKLVGERIDPETLNPVPRLEADRPADPAAEAAEVAEGWANLRAGFEQLARQRQHGGRHP